MPADQTFLQLAAVEAAASGTIAKYIPQQAHIYLREKSAKSSVCGCTNCTNCQNTVLYKQQDGVFWVLSFLMN